MIGPFLSAKHLNLPDDPTSLSFQLLKIVPISQKLVLEAMHLNSPIQRLRWIINILDSQVPNITIHTSIKYLTDNILS